MDEPHRTGRLCYRGWFPAWVGGLLPQEAAFGGLMVEVSFSQIESDLGKRAWERILAACVTEGKLRHVPSLTRVFATVSGWNGQSANHCLVGAGVVMKPLCPRPRPKNTVTEMMLEVCEGTS